jgi:hypothetical protein
MLEVYLASNRGWYLLKVVIEACNRMFIESIETKECPSWGRSKDLGIVKVEK